MKKIFLLFITAICSFALCFALTGCGSEAITAENIQKNANYFSNDEIKLTQQASNSPEYNISVGDKSFGTLTLVSGDRSKLNLTAKVDTKKDKAADTFLYLCQGIVKTCQPELSDDKVRSTFISAMNKPDTFVTQENLRYRFSISNSQYTFLVIS